MEGRGKKIEKKIKSLNHPDFIALLEDFTLWLTRLNYASCTIKSRKRHLHCFLLWLQQNGITDLKKISIQDLQNYNQYLHQKPIKAKTIESYLSVLKQLNVFLQNYGQEPIIKTKLHVEKPFDTPREILSKQEVNLLYDTCNLDAWGLRDRILLAIFYGCGLRCREGVKLEVKDIDFSTGLLHVRRGKNYRERYVPMSPGVIKELKHWLEGPQKWFAGINTNYLIPNRYGKECKNAGINKRISKLTKASGINKKITLHCLRHSIATHLLQSGMKLEQISRFLGHQSLESTQIYTHLNDEQQL